MTLPLFPLLLCILLSSSSSNLYTDPEQESCSAPSPGDSGTAGTSGDSAGDCGCGSLKRDISQTSSLPGETGCPTIFEMVLFMLTIHYSIYNCLSDKAWSTFTLVQCEAK